MYESMTFESILRRMLGRIPSTMDKREGSIIYDALAPAAVELQLMYIEADVILKETFADTATRQYLIRRAYERGVAPFDATYAILKGEFNINVPIGARFNCAELNYIVTEKITDGQFKMQCESLGIVGNKNFGRLIPIDYIDGLESATLTELLIPSEDEEDTELFRKRYLDSFRTQAFGGNRADYIEKVGALAGVGGVKVYRAWDGGGTVKLVIIDSDFKEPSAELIDKVQTEIDPVVNGGEGLGIAPIDHRVTVFGVAPIAVDVETTITFADGWSFADVEQYIYDAIDDYFKELNATWSDNESLSVRISQIETRLLDIEGVIDIADTKLNGEGKNLILSGDDIAKRGEFVC